MYATIRQYEEVNGTAEELTQAARQLADSLSRVRGFVSCFVLEAEPGALATISIFEDLAGLEEANRLTEAALSERRGRLLSQGVPVTSGEIVFQRGL
jgi:heme-degrading monooxygenase HmoA